ESFLLPRFGDGNKLTYKDPSEDTIYERSEEWEKGHNKWLTTNQIIRERNKLAGEDMKEIPGGDDIYHSLTNVPLGEERPVDNNSQTPVNEEKKKKVTKTEEVKKKQVDPE